MSTKGIHHHRVNWMDGMKISKDHFIAQENAMIDLMSASLSAGINPNSYGLLGASEGENALDISISIDAQNTIQVVLRRCSAITQGGHLIAIDAETEKFLSDLENGLTAQLETSEDHSIWDIILTVDPFNSVAIGNADPEETPPRKPNVISNYQIDIIPVKADDSKDLGLHQLVIGRVIKSDGALVVDDQYIAPCNSIQSHPDLQYTFVEVSSFLNQIETYSLHIIQKIKQKEQNNELAKMTNHLCEVALRYLNLMIPQFRYNTRFAPPVDMVSKIVSLARIIKTNFDVFAGTGKEDFLNYLTDWCDLNQGAFEKVLSETIELNYQHTDINNSLVRMSEFTKLMLTLFKKLNELEYIGQKEDKGLFVKEEVIENKEVKSRRSFLLD